jgi:hypothetical protein
MHHPHVQVKIESTGSSIVFREAELANPLKLSHERFETEREEAEKRLTREF